MILEVQINDTTYVGNKETLVKQGVALDLIDVAKSKVLLTEMMSVLSQKMTDAKSLLLGYKNNDAQIELYQRLANRARAGEFTNAENAKILAAEQALLTSLHQFDDLIQTARKGIEALIDASEFEKAQAAIEAAKGFDSATTQSDVQALFE